ncbi:hypothetical protein [Streptomyces himalayensis]|uniref:Uncharacterized protein n=1 Tax=Streptomyces himalayensis subsp. himalayensis TaxID=2756131 RepID=A0A7W0DVF0_9ACTN|nr:hypothetical protein [Streptomyces himalayensis]MBA2951615.1 hypothetical protein [Streptomyces himalayensis subsp. himalayensis]
MTQSPDALRRQLIASLNAISDPEERLRKFNDIESELKLDFKQVKARIARDLKAANRTWPQVGEIFGVTGARAEQISRAAR